MNKYLFCSLLLSGFSIYGIDDIKNVGSVATENANQADQEKKIAVAREHNSLIEAFMAGKLHVTEVGLEKTITYPDYMKPSLKYTQPLEKAQDALTETYRLTNFMIGNHTPFPIQTQMSSLAKMPLTRERKCAHLRDALSEPDKTQLQCLRLHDFLKNKDFSLPASIETQIKQIAKSDLSDDQKMACLKIFEDQFNLNYHFEALKANRQVLKNAMKEGDVKIINAACTLPLHFEKFTSLDNAVQKMIANITKNTEDVDRLLNNYSRVWGL